MKLGRLTLTRRSAEWDRGVMVLPTPGGGMREYPDKIIVLTSWRREMGHFTDADPRSLYVLRNDFRDVIFKCPWPRRWWPK